MDARVQAARFSAASMSGAMGQAELNTTMETVERGSVRVVVCTDLAVQGVHIETCDGILQLDVPD